MMTFYFSYLEAVKIVAIMWKNPKKGQKMMNLHMKQIGLSEMFLEAVPTVFVMTILMITAQGLQGNCRVTYREIVGLRLGYDYPIHSD